MMMVTYFVVLEVFYHTFYFLIPLLFFSIFAFFYFKEKRRLINGVLFNTFLIVFGGYEGPLNRDAKYLYRWVIGFDGIPILILLAIGIYILIIFLFWNGVVVMKKESRTLANLLTLLLGVALTIFLILDYTLVRWLPQWANALFAVIPFIFAYLLIVFFNFMTVSILYQFNRPRYNQDYIVVLGAGLIDGERVSPLLLKDQ